MAAKQRLVTMGKADLQFQIDQLRKDKMIYGIESIVVSFLAVLSAVFLPEIVYRFVFNNGQTQANLEVLGLIPVIAYAVAAGYTVFVLLGNVSRLGKIKKLERELMSA